MKRPTMQHLLTAEGEAALALMAARSTLLAFDFDGTLAPIAPRPELVQVPTGVADRLHRLSKRVALAVITGRSLADVAPRLGFEPQYLVGNHGAEGALGWSAPMQDWAVAVHARLAQHAEPLATAGVTVEDKGYSLALHYRLAPDAQRAVRAIEAALDGLDASHRIFGGKCVLNVAPADAPDKGEALQQLVREAGVAGALFVGDDVNDEPAFACAQAHWVTVRIGPDGQDSKARFYLRSTDEVVAMLDRLLVLLPG